MEQAIAPIGLRPRELLVLQHLRDRGPSAQQTLVELVGVDATNLVGVLNRLEDAALIDRRRDRADRRRGIIELSRQGAKVLDDLDRALGDLDDEILGPLTGSERANLHGLLSKAVQHIALGCTPPTDEEC